eukprot:277807_1
MTNTEMNKVHRFEGNMRIKGFRIAYVIWIPLHDTTVGLNDIAIDPLVMTHYFEETIVCFHGWLDNANSYATLAPLLCSQFNMRVIGIDLPGHGKSTHSLLGYYDAAMYATSMIRILSRLHVRTFHLMGHSLSAIFLPFVVPVLEHSGKFIVKSLTCIEQFGALYNTCDVKAVRIETLLPSESEDEHETDSNEYGSMKRLPRLYNSIEELVRSRIYVTEQIYPGEQTISTQSAKVILERNVGKLVVIESGTRKKQTKYYLRFDPKLRDGRNTLRNVFVYDMKTMAKNVIQKAKCPMLGVFGDTGWPLSDTIAKVYVNKSMDNMQIIRIKGSHHLHADDPQTFLKTITPFLKNAIEKYKNERTKDKAHSKL